MFRFTKDIIPKVLKANEGFKWVTFFEGNNGARNRNIYNIKDGKLFCTSEGKTSWAHSRYNETEECDLEQTRRFLRKVKDRLKLDV